MESKLRELVTAAEQARLTAEGMEFMKRFAEALQTGTFTPELVEELLLFLQSNEKLGKEGLTERIKSNAVETRAQMIGFLVKTLKLQSEVTAFVNDICVDKP